MDVSAPRHIPPARDIAVQPAPVAPASEVRTAPLATASPANIPLTTAAQKKPAVHEVSHADAPVGVITVAVLVMMLLSGAAVLVYVTSQTA